MLEKHERKKKNEKIRHNNMNASAYCKKSKKNIWLEMKKEDWSIFFHGYIISSIFFNNSFVYSIACSAWAKV